MTRTKHPDDRAAPAKVENAGARRAAAVTTVTIGQFRVPHPAGALAQQLLNSSTN
jgi:hypothetical protein